MRCWAIVELKPSSYHIITNHSPKIQKSGNQLDYLGIVILMWGSTIPSIYYGFYCDPKLQKAYWANVLCTFSHALTFLFAASFTARAHSHWVQVSILASLCIAVTLHPKFRHPTIRPYRAAMYAGLGLSAIVFVVHGVMLHGWTVQNRRMSLDWMGLMAFFNLAGAVTYAARVRCHFPEPNAENATVRKCWFF